MTKNDFEDLGFLANAFSISSNGSIVEVSKKEVCCLLLQA